MKKKNKKFLVIGLISAVIISFIALYLLFGLTVKSIPPIGGKLLENCGPGGNSVCFGIKQESNYFKCDADVCGVTGELSCNSQRQAQKVVADLSNGLMINGECWSTQTGFTSGSASWHCSSPYYIGTFGDGRRLGIMSDKAYVCPTSTSSNILIYKKGGSCSIVNTVSVCGPAQICTGQTAYDCNWKFCPSTNTNFPYCNKLDTFMTSWVGTTTPKYELKRDESITFNPVGYNNNALAQSQFRFVIDKYTTACAVTSSNNDRICNVGQKYCQGCPSGYSLAYNKWCYYVDGTGVWAYVDTVCWNGNGQQCKSASTDKYLTCDGITTDINKCNTWKTQGTCSGGLKCYVDGQTSLGLSGVGDCKCNPSQCSRGTRKPGDVSNWYQECMASGACSAFIRQDCPTQNGVVYLYDDLLKKCRPPTSSESPLICSQVDAKKCDGNNLITCKQYNMNGCTTTTTTTCSTNTYFAWDTPGMACTGMTCTSDTSKLVPNAVCEPIKRCAINAVSCTGTNSLVSCVDDGYGGTTWGTTQRTCEQAFLAKCPTGWCICDVNDCEIKSGCDYKNPDCAAGQKCVNNQCISTGCAFGDLVCPDSQQCDKVNNKCVCKTTTPYCGVQGVKSCSGSGYLVCNIPTGDGCYKWTTSPVVCDTPKVCTTVSGVVGCNCPSTSCTVGVDDRCKPGVNNVIQSCNNVNGCGVWTDKATVCNEGFVCRAQSPAQCVMVGNAAIQTQAAFGTNEPINGINITVSSNVGGNVGVGVVALLYDGSFLFEGAKVSTQTNDEGMAFVNFGVSSAAAKTLTIKAQISLVPDACSEDIQTDKCIIVTKSIEVKPKLDLRLNAPVQCYKSSICKVTYKTLDTESGSIITTNPATIIVPGYPQFIPKDYPDGKGFEFEPTKLGNVAIEVTVTKSGYLPDTEKSLVSIVTPTISVDTKVSGADINTLSTGISTGSKAITFDIREAGQPTDASIEGYVFTPSGEEKKLTFIRSSSGLLTANYNFEEAGKTYTLRGKIVFADPNKADQEFEYQLATIGSGGGTGGDVGGDWDTGTYVWIILGIVFGIIIIIVMVKVLKRK